MNKKEEKHLQKQCEDYLRIKRVPYLHLNTYALCFKCKSWHAVNANKGIPDLLTFFDGGRLVFIELKTSKGNLSKEQKAFKEKMEDKGFSYFVIRDFDTFKYVIDSIIDKGFIPELD